MTEMLAQWLAGLVLIVVVARARFRRPAGVRMYTTAAWYHFGLAIYLAAFVVPYAVLSRHPAVPPILVALGLVALVSVPGLSSIDSWLRRWLHHMIGVPSQAHRLAESLVAAELRAGDAVEAEVRSVLQRRGYDADENWLPAAEPMRKLWFKTAVLFQQVRTWEERGPYRQFVQSTPHEFNTLRERFDQLSLKVVRVLATVDRLAALLCEVVPAGRDAATAAADPGSTVKTVIGELLADAREDVAFFLKNLCLYVARGVLAGSVTAGGRRRRLRNLGFTIEPPLRSLPSVLGWAFVAYLVVFVGFLVVPPLVTGGIEAASTADNMLRVLMIATIQVAALMLAILAKNNLGCANEDLRGRTPLGFIFGAGVAAVALAAPIQLLFVWMIADGDLTRAWGDFGAGSPWLLTAAMTTSLTAFLIQDGRWFAVRSRWARRLLDTACMALGMVVAVEVAVLLHAPTTLQRPGRLAAAILIGLVIGGTVPSSRRRELVPSSTGPVARFQRARARMAPSTLDGRLVHGETGAAHDGRRIQAS